MNVRLTDSISRFTKLFTRLSVGWCQDMTVTTRTKKINGECLAVLKTNSHCREIKRLSFSHCTESGHFSRAGVFVCCPNCRYSLPRKNHKSQIDGCGQFSTFSSSFASTTHKSKSGKYGHFLMCSLLFPCDTCGNEAGECIESRVLFTCCDSCNNTASESRLFFTYYTYNTKTSECRVLLTCNTYNTTAVEGRVFLTCSGPLTCQTSQVKQFRTQTYKPQQILTQATFHTCSAGGNLQRSATTRHSTKTRSKKRIPLSHTQEIEEVLEEHAEVIQQFAAVLGCSLAAMTDMVRRDTRLVTQFDKESVMAKMRLLLSHGFTAREILSRYQVFSRSQHHLQSRLTVMDTVKHYKHRLATLLLSEPQFQARMAAYQKEVAIMGHHSSQTSFLAELLECTPAEVSSLASQNHCEFLLTLPPSRLQEIVAVLRSFGVSVADIRRKCLMLRCMPDVARYRLQRVSDAGVFDLKLVSFILTNSDSHFEPSFAWWVRNAKALGSYANERELLMDRLQCSEEDIESLMRRKTVVAELRAAKLKSSLDVLQKEIGLSSEMILQQGNLLYCSPQRMLARWALLKPFGLSEPALARELLLAENKFIAKYGYGSD